MYTYCVCTDINHRRHTDAQVSRDTFNVHTNFCCVVVDVEKYNYYTSRQHLLAICILAFDSLGYYQIAAYNNVEIFYRLYFLSFSINYKTYIEY